MEEVKLSKFEMKSALVKTTQSSENKGSKTAKEGKNFC